MFPGREGPNAEWRGRRQRRQDKLWSFVILIGSKAPRRAEPYPGSVLDRGQAQTVGCRESRAVMPTKGTEEDRVRARMGGT